MKNILKITYKKNDKNFIKQFFFGILWILFFFSININPESLNDLNFTQLLRLTAPLLFISFFLILSFNKNLFFFGNENFFFYLFIIYIFLGIFFIFVNPHINSYLNLYWGILMLSPLIYIYSFKNSSEQLRIFLILSLLLILLVFSYHFIKIIFLMISINELFNLYGITSSHLNYSDTIDNINPRSSGLSRMSFILYISFVIYLITTKKKSYVTNLIFIFAIILGTIGLLFQSRTMNFIFLIFCILLLIIYFKKKNLFNKKLIFFFIFIPIMFAVIYISLLRYKENNPESLKQSQTLNNFFNQNVLLESLIRKSNSENYSSSRFSLWQKSMEISKKNIFLGYGFQADRKLIKDSVHNVYLYSLISGGFIAMSLIILLSLRGAFTSFLILADFILSKRNYLTFDIIPACLVPLFLMRGLLETSYGIYSIDYLIFILCFTINEINYKKFKYLKFS